MKIDWMKVRLKLKVLFRLSYKVFATYYVIGEWNDIIRAMDELHISGGETVNDNYEIDDIQYNGFFPDEGQVTIKSMGNQDDGCKRWKVTFEVSSRGFEKLNYWLSPMPMECQTFDKIFKYPHHGDSVEFGIM